MKLWNGSELHAEYAGFQVGDASTGYRMTYREMLRHRSSVSFDAFLEHHKDMRFSTMDRDNDVSRYSCSNECGRGGWWFKDCHHVNPNAVFPSREKIECRYMTWHSGSVSLSLREVRLMLQI
ncbi:hypothetical protein BOX15_Mlig019144g3 [Macrostomum lignano]|nr:hypothetical protein BOX15_Mlig019144g3 [Macrostomum lignano]